MKTYEIKLTDVGKARLRDLVDEKAETLYYKHAAAKLDGASVARLSALAEALSFWETIERAISNASEVDAS